MLLAAGTSLERESRNVVDWGHRRMTDATLYWQPITRWTESKEDIYIYTDGWRWVCILDTS